MFWNNKAEKEKDDFILEDGEREVLYTIGKYDIYDANSETRMIIDDMIGEQKQVVKDVSILQRLFINLTNIPEEKLTLERMVLMQRNPKKLFTQINKKINLIVEEELVDILGQVEMIKKMPKRAQEIYIEKIMDANEKIEKMK